MSIAEEGTQRRPVCGKPDTQERQGRFWPNSVRDEQNKADDGLAQRAGNQMVSDYPQVAASTEVSGLDVIRVPHGEDLRSGDTSDGNPVGGNEGQHDGGGRPFEKERPRRGRG